VRSDEEKERLNKEIAILSVFIFIWFYFDKLFSEG
jgi:hypothetical protein